MDENTTCAFQAGTEITEFKRRLADCWIIYVSEGKAEFVIEQDVYPAIAGQVVIVGLMNKDVQIKASDDYISYVLKINDTISAELVRRHLVLMSASNKDVSVITTGRQRDSIALVFKNIISELDANRENSSMILSLLLQELLVRLYRAAPASDMVMYGNRNQIVLAVCSLLGQEYSRNLSLKDIAAEYNISSSYLSHIFKEIVGVSVMRYLLSCRVLAAREYLEQTTLPVNEIAEMCGFNDVSNFGRTFKKETGYSPRQYRQAHFLNKHKPGQDADS